MQLLVMRHGEAEIRAPSDAQRNLTEAGRQQAISAGKWLSEHGHRFQQLWVSPYRRARQTAECLELSLGPLPHLVVDNLTPDSSPAELIEQLAEVEVPYLALVSHNPFVTDLLTILTGGSRPISMGTATIALVEADILLPGCCELRWLRHAPLFGQA